MLARRTPLVVPLPLHQMPFSALGILLSLQELAAVVEGLLLWRFGGRWAASASEHGVDIATESGELKSGLWPWSPMLPPRDAQYKFALYEMMVPVNLEPSFEPLCAPVGSFQKIRGFEGSFF